MEVSEGLHEVVLPEFGRLVLVLDVSYGAVVEAAQDSGGDDAHGGVDAMGRQVVVDWGELVMDSDYDSGRSSGDRSLRGILSSYIILAPYSVP